MGGEMGRSRMEMRLGRDFVEVMEEARECDGVKKERGVLESLMLLLEVVAGLGRDSVGYIPPW